MHPRAPHWVAIAAVAGALLAWWLWPQGADAPTSETPVSTDAQGRVRLTRQQERNLGIRTERSRAATDVPVTGLPAEAMSPLATTTQLDAAQFDAAKAEPDPAAPKDPAA